LFQRKLTPTLYGSATWLIRKDERGTWKDDLAGCSFAFAAHAQAPTGRQ
jgi:hypothetical protein